MTRLLPPGAAARLLRPRRCCKAGNVTPFFCFTPPQVSNTTHHFSTMTYDPEIGDNQYTYANFSSWECVPSDTLPGGCFFPLGMHMAGVHMACTLRCCSPHAVCKHVHAV